MDAAIQDAIAYVSTRMTTRLRAVDRKVCARVRSRLLELEEALSKAPSQCELHSEKILTTVESVKKSLWGNAGWDVSDSLKELLPLVASDDWVYRALVEERVRSADAPHGWNAISSKAKLDKLIDDYHGAPSALDGKLARQNLTALYGLRNDRGRHDRAREGSRVEYLGRVAFGLLLLLAISVGSMRQLETSGPWSAIIIVFFAGGLGAVLGGIIRIRDVERSAQLDFVWRTMGSQIVLGGALAVIVLVTLQTGLVRLGNLDFTKAWNPAAVFMVGIISGYSEPFSLGLLKKAVDLVK